MSSSLARRAAKARLPAAPKPVVLPDDDDDPEAPQGLTIGHAEGQTFMIEYVDSAGRHSQRRITVWDLVEGRGGWPCLRAQCHERNAVRQFRIDRIKNCIDLDGVVYGDVFAFLEDAFGMRIPDADRHTSAAQERQDWSVIAGDIKPAAVILAAMAQSDGVTRKSEILVATDKLALSAEKLGHTLTDEHVLRLENLLRRMRPTKNAISRALAAMESYDTRRVRDLLLAAVAVMNADGQRHPAEIEMLDEVALELTGTTLVVNHGGR